MDLTKITPLILTHDEVPNIARTLNALDWAPRILVIDSGSTDGTLEILERYPQVECLHREFDTFADQRNFGLINIRSTWTLSIDADHYMTAAAVREISEMAEPLGKACLSPFRYAIWGRPILGAILPPRPVLFQTGLCRYQPDGHSETLVFEGKPQRLHQAFVHDDRKPLCRWFHSQIGYAEQEASKLLEGRELGFADRVRLLMVVAPWLVPLLCLARGAALSGWRGWFYAMQRSIAESMLALRIADKRFGGGDE